MLTYRETRSDQIISTMRSAVSGPLCSSAGMGPSGATRPFHRMEIRICSFPYRWTSLPPTCSPGWSRTVDSSLQGRGQIWSRLAAQPFVHITDCPQYRRRQGTARNL